MMAGWVDMEDANRERRAEDTMGDVQQQIIRSHEQRINALLVENSRLRDENSRLREALTESVKLQSHYATLLNATIGGERLTFDSPGAWIDRLDAVRAQNPTLADPR